MNSVVITLSVILSGVQAERTKEKASVNSESLSFFDQGYHEIKLLKTMNYVCFINMTINGRDMTMMIDTGIYCDFALTKAGRSKIGDYFRVVNRDAKVAAFNGVATVELGYISQINIVGSGIEDAKNEYLCGYSATATTECAYFDKLTNQVVRVPFDGFIGNNFLKKLSAVIDYDQDKMYLIPLTAKEMPKLAGEWRLNTATGIVAVKPELLISGDSSISIDLSSGRIEGKIKLVRDHNYDAIFIGEEKTTAGGFYRRTSLNDLELLLMQGTFEEIQEAFRSMSPQIFNAKDKGKFTHYKFKKVAAHAKK